MEWTTYIKTRLCIGFKYENYLILRDLKPANILFKDGVIKIADFGFAKII